MRKTTTGKEGLNQHTGRRNLEEIDKAGRRRKTPLKTVIHIPTDRKEGITAMKLDQDAIFKYHLRTRNMIAD